MRNILISIILISTLAGCASTPAPEEKDKSFVKQTFDNASSVTSALEVEVGSEYSSTFKSIGAGFGSTVDAIESDYGTFYLFRTKTGHAWPMHQHPFYDAAKKSFTASCAGEVSPLTGFEKADRKGLFDPLHYTTEDKLDLMKKHATTHAGKFPYYLKLSYGSMLDREKEQYRDSLNNIGFLFLNEISVTGEEHTWRKEMRQLVKGSQSACYRNGKIHGAVIYFSSYYGVKEGAYNSSTVPKSGSHSFVGLYIPPETANNVAQHAFESRYANVLRQSDKKQRRENKRLARKKALDNHNEYRAAVWSNRFKLDYTPGDKVCSADNKMGYVESANERNVKVWFKGIVRDKESKFFFGNSDSLPDSKFYYRKVDETTWVAKGDIARCDFTSV